MQADGDGSRPRRRAAAPQFDQSPTRPTRSTRSGRPSNSYQVRSSRRSAIQDDVSDEDEDTAYDLNTGDQDEDDDFESTSAQRRTRLGRGAQMSSEAPSGRPIRQRTTSNMNDNTPSPSRHQRGSSRTANKVQVEEENEEEPDEADQDEADDDENSVQPSDSNAQITISSPVKQSALEDSDEKVEIHKKAGKERPTDESDSGWIEEMDDPRQEKMIYMTIIDKIRSWLAERGDGRLTEFMETEPKNKDQKYFETVHRPTSLQAIEARIQDPERGFATSILFEKAVLLLFHNGRRYFEQATETYGNLLTLQRMYQHLTQSVDSVTEGIDDEIKSRNYASNKYGPGQEADGRDAGESTSVGQKTNVNRHHYKGMKIAVGNWVHLMNPTDPSRPIIAQIFKSRTEDLGDHHQDWVTANWFLRPEQSKHPRSMCFWSNEVIKTSQYVEHHVEDILEVICVIFYTKASRGMPAEGEGGWHTGDPIYICEMRYQPDRDAFFKIKNWASCMPEEVRQKRFDLVEFERPIPLPDKLASPFLRGIEGPGGLVSDVRPSMNVPTSSSRSVNANLLNQLAPRASRRPARKSDYSAMAFGEDSEILQLFKEWRDEVQTQRKNFLKMKRQEKEAAAAAELERKANESGRQAATTVEGETPQPEAIGLTGMGVAKTSSSPFARATPLPIATSPITTNSNVNRVPVIAPSVDRSLNNAMSQMDASAYFKPLPESTQQLFHQDPETGNVVWYPAPPMIGSNELTIQRKWNHGERFQSHSLDYLYFMANNKSSATANNESTRSKENVDLQKRKSNESEQVEPRSKRRAVKNESETCIIDPKLATENVENAFSRAIYRAGEELSSFISIEP